MKREIIEQDDEKSESLMEFVYKKVREAKVMPYWKKIGFKGRLKEGNKDEV